MKEKTSEQELELQAILNNHITNKLIRLEKKLVDIEKNQLESHEKLVASYVRLTREIVVCVVIATIIILVFN